MTSQMLSRFREYLSSARFDAIRVGIASSERIRALSYGEVKKTETINYRTLKPERDGLFCARIFGPVKDWECNCGKYRRMKHRGITCEKCGVEVIQSRVRRERMGHIELVAPVTHIWFLKGVPGYLGIILDMTVKDIEKIVYFDSVAVLTQGNSPYPRGTVLSYPEYNTYRENNPKDDEFSAESGAVAVRDLLRSLDLETEVVRLKEGYKKSGSVANRHKILRRMRVLNAMSTGGIKPEWMVMDVVPVLPPDLRPLVPLEGGRFASSDLNELYRRVLNRNIRLRRLLEIEAPDVIIKNEKRMLQESVDALIDNGRRGNPVRGSNKRQLKSLSEMLRGKQGRFRQNLLGKRVDYSARSVIVVDPELEMHRCGIPKIMALELFKPHVYAGLIKNELAANLKIAKKMVDDHLPEIWDILEDVVRDRVVLLNRAPTLHRLSILGFYPVLVDGKAIKIHPLTCAAFNADFDGDQMAVHLPLSKKAQDESKALMLASNNVLSPASGRPVAVPSQDMILGVHYMTKARCGAKGEGLTFSGLDEVIAAYQHGAVSLHSRINVFFPGDGIVKTTTGRVLLFSAAPPGAEFDWVNLVMKKSDVVKLVERVYYIAGPDKTVEFLDSVKKLGFYYSTVGGISFGIDDLVIPRGKGEILAKAEEEAKQVEQLYLDGLITNGERYNKTVSIWGRATNQVMDSMMAVLETQNKEAFVNKEKNFQDFNPIFMMLDSGARGSMEQIRQIVGMRGLMSKPSGEVMETPVKNNFREGLSVFDYFISTHGARKGQSDTALKTANSGYLTRRLVDVAQDVVVTKTDCGTLGYAEIGDLKAAGGVIRPVHKRVIGRVLAADVKDPISGELLLKRGDFIDRASVEVLRHSAVSKILVRSPLTCQVERGICTKCYGYDLSKIEPVDVGVAVGIIAAQSIGEPGTQLTMRTFHIGGTASGFGEKPVFTSKHEGVVKLRGLSVVEDRHGDKRVISRKGSIAILSGDGRELQRNNVEYGSKLHVGEGDEVKVGQVLVEWDPHSVFILTDKQGKVSYDDLVENITYRESFDESSKHSSRVVLASKDEKYEPAISVLKGDDVIATYHLPTGAYVMVEDGADIRAGDVVAKLPREVSKTRDITGGLPRIAELFEARMPKDMAVMSEVDGKVKIGGIHRGLRKITVESDIGAYDYFAPRGRQLNVIDGEFVAAGDLLTSGSPSLQDMLRIMGPDVVQRYLVNNIQEIYTLQGITIADAHVEVIVRQMLRKVRVTDPGDSDFLIGDRVDKVRFRIVNEALREEGKKAASAEPVLMGITTASLMTESVISAASFQETTRILAEAAVSGKVDYLYGLKENVAIGRLIPAGTGVKTFREKYLGKDVSELEQRALEAEEAVTERG